MAGILIVPRMALPSEIGLALRLSARGAQDQGSAGRRLCHRWSDAIEQGRIAGSAAELDVRETPERLVTGQESRANSARGRVPDRVRVRQLWTSDLQPHRLEQPSVLWVYDNRPKPRELTLGLDFPSFPKNGQVQFDEIPDARSQLCGEIPSVPRIPPHDFNERIGVEEEPRRATIPDGDRL